MKELLFVERELDSTLFCCLRLLLLVLGAFLFDRLLWMVTASLPGVATPLTLENPACADETDHSVSDVLIPDVLRSFSQSSR